MLDALLVQVPHSQTICMDTVSWTIISVAGRGTHWFDWSSLRLEYARG
jgi:hypothetical protein